MHDKLNVISDSTDGNPWPAQVVLQSSRSQFECNRLHNVAHTGVSPSSRGGLYTVQANKTDMKEGFMHPTMHQA
jgi:hypothetical protein